MVEYADISGDQILLWLILTFTWPCCLLGYNRKVVNCLKKYGSTIYCQVKFGKYFCLYFRLFLFLGPFEGSWRMLISTAGGQWKLGQNLFLLSALDTFCSLEFGVVYLWWWVIFFCLSQHQVYIKGKNYITFLW